MFCKTCGAEIHDDAVVCIHCGCATDNKPSVPADKASTILVILSFIMPLVGLILAITAQVAGKKKTSNSYAAAAGIALLLYVLSIVLFAFIGS